MSTGTLISSLALVDRYRDIYEQRMQGLPFVNTKLDVEAIGFREFQDFELGVLISPWFMNLVILPNAGLDDRLEQGRKIRVRLPSEVVEFMSVQDEEIGLYLSAVLFSSVMDFPDQETAKSIAQQVMQDLFDKDHESELVSRRSLFTSEDRVDA
jgi:[NiFe] hydrogenase assembly HybE family chaperone